MIHGTTKKTPKNARSRAELVGGTGSILCAILKCVVIIASLSLMWDRARMKLHAYKVDYNVKIRDIGYPCTEKDT